METKEIIKGIKRIQGRAETQQADVQEIGLACIEQVKQYGNTTYLGNLYLALSKGDKDAFARWALKFGGVKANLKKANKAVLPFVVGEVQADIDAARATPWHNFQKDATPVERLQDEGKTVQNLIARLLKGEGFKNAEQAVELGRKLQSALLPVEAVPA